MYTFLLETKFVLAAKIVPQVVNFVTIFRLHLLQYVCCTYFRLLLYTKCLLYCYFRFYMEVEATFLGTFWNIRFDMGWPGLCSSEVVGEVRGRPEDVFPIQLHIVNKFRKITSKNFVKFRSMPRLFPGGKITCLLLVLISLFSWPSHFFNLVFII